MKLNFTFTCLALQYVKNVAIYIWKYNWTYNTNRSHFQIELGSTEFYITEWHFLKDVICDNFVPASLNWCKPIEERTAWKVSSQTSVFSGILYDNGNGMNPFPAHSSLPVSFCQWLPCSTLPYHEPR